MIAVRTLYAHYVRALGASWARGDMLQLLFARIRSVMDATKTTWKRRVNTVGTLWGRCVHAITGKFDF